MTLGAASGVSDGCGLGFGVLGIPSEDLQPRTKGIVFGAED